MAESVVDTLSIRINADTKTAIASIKKLAGTLAGLSSSVGKSVTHVTRFGTAFKSLGLPTVTGHAKNLTSAFTKMSSSSKSSASAFSSVSVAVGRLTPSASSLAKTLGQVYLQFFSLRKAVDLFKESIALSSDLVETQHVVDTVFGDMAYKVEDFVKTANTEFGLSELTVKKAASRFQSLGAALGMPTGQISDMSIELTKLTGNMSSFFNKDQQTVMEDLQAIYTGMARPLRKYGIDLTQASLKEYALSKGLDSNISAMTQAEKTMLRYQYVMEKLGYVTDDFKKTSDTWANSTRILRQNFQQLGVTFGTIITNFLKPFVRSMNAVMGTLQAGAKNVADALGTIFGWTYTVNGGGGDTDVYDVLAEAEDEMAGLAEGADGTASGLSDAVKNAQELKRTVLGFDSLNLLNAPTSSSSSSGKSGSSGDADMKGATGAGGLDTSIVWTGGLIEKYKSEIDNLYKLGAYISDALKKAMDSINWQDIYARASGFGSGLADFLNGLINPGMFASLGNTIAGALNSVLFVVNSFTSGFSWANLGQSLGAAVNSIFTNFRFDVLGSTIADWYNGVATYIANLASTIRWSLVGARISETLWSFFSRWRPEVSAEAFYNLANGLFESFESAVTTAPWQLAGTKISTFIRESLEGIEWNRIYATMRKLGDGLADFFINLIRPDTFAALGSTIRNGLMAALEGINSFITKFFGQDGTIGESLAAAINEVFEGGKLGERVGETIGNWVNGITSQAARFAKNLDWKDLGLTISGTINKFFRTWNPTFYAEFFSTAVNGLMSSALTAFTTAEWANWGAKVGTFVQETIGDIDWDTAYQAAAAFGSGLADFLNNLCTPETFAAVGKTIAGSLSTALSGLASFASDFDWDGFGSSVAAGISDFFRDFDWKGFGQVLTTFISGLITALAAFIRDTDWTAVGNGIRDMILGLDWAGILVAIGNFLGAILNAAIVAATGLLDFSGIKTSFEGAADGITIDSSGVITGITTFGTELYNAFAKNIDVEAVSEALGNLAEGFDAVIGVLAPLAAGTFDVVKDFIVFLATVSALAINLVADGINSFANALRAIPESEFIKTIAEALRSLVDAYNEWVLALGASATYGEEYWDGSAEQQEQYMGEIRAQMSILDKSITDSANKYGILSKAVKRLADNGALTQGQIDAINQLLADGQQDVAGYNDVADPLAEILSNAGITGADFYRALELVYQELGLAAPEQAEMNSQVNEARAVFAETAGKADSFAESMSGAGDSIAGAKGDMEEMTRYSTSTGLAGLSAYADSAGNAAGKVSDLADASGSLAGEAEEASTKTGNVSSVLDLMKGSSLASQIKMLLLVTALSNLAKKSGTSAEKQQLLGEAIDTATQYGGDFDLVAESLKDTLGYAGVNSSELAKELQNAAKEMGTSETKTDGATESVGEFQSQLRDLLDYLADGGEERAGEYVAGLSGGIASGTPEVGSAAAELASTVNDTVASEFDSHSPSRVAMSLGQYFGQGLTNGLSAGISSVSMAASSLANAVTSGFGNNLSATSVVYGFTNSIVTAMSGMYNTMYNIGTNMSYSLRNGLQSVRISTPYMYLKEWASVNLGSNGTQYLPRYDVKWLASGGLATRATVAGIGEAGTEGILPLSNSKAMRSVADAITGNMASGQDIIAGAVADAMMAYAGQMQDRPVNVYSTLTCDGEVLARSVQRGQRRLNYRLNPSGAM